MIIFNLNLTRYSLPTYYRMRPHQLQYESDNLTERRKYFNNRTLTRLYSCLKTRSKVHLVGPKLQSVKLIKTVSPSLNAPAAECGDRVPGTRRWVARWHNYIGPTSPPATRRLERLRRDRHTPHTYRPQSTPLISLARILERHFQMKLPWRCRETKR